MNTTKVILISIGAFVLGALLVYLTLSFGMTNSQSSDVAQNGDIVSVAYTGKLTNGTVFDSTDLHGGTPIEFKLGASMVIKGWDEGIVGMKIGEKKTMTIPPEKGYGSRAIPDGKGGMLIPANSTLVFDVELKGIYRPVQTAGQK